jgi:hypothetical protein
MWARSAAMHRTTSSAIGRDPELDRAAAGERRTAGRSSPDCTSHQRRGDSQFQPSKLDRRDGHRVGKHRTGGINGEHHTSPAVSRQ